ncbi:hypothetical protein [Bacillus toyonensis]|nr:hypothetical protein [Bacillus toyonensis]
MKMKLFMICLLSVICINTIGEQQYGNYKENAQETRTQPYMNVDPGGM